jgi:Tol biopolymer transport system component
MPNCTGLVNSCVSLWSNPGKKLFLLVSYFLLIISACSPSPPASPENLNSPTLPAASPLESTPTPTNQIVFPTLLPTKTHEPVEVIPSPTPSPVQEYPNSIVFVSDRDGNKDIYRIDANGSDFTRLTESIENDSSPRWSHDKARLLFLSSAGDSNHLYTINPDGRDMLNLTPGTGVSQCDWSPVSYQIACLASNEDSVGNDLILIDADEGRINTAFSAGGDLLDMAWSPDGGKIALAAANVDGILVYDLAEDSLGEFELGAGFAQRVAWSHNGNRLAYSFGPRAEGAIATLYTVKMDFSNPRKWIEKGGPDWVQSFSPGDEYVLLESSRLGHSEIFIFDLAAGELIQLTNTEEGQGDSASVNRSPVYSTDGRRIVYVSIQEGGSDLYVMNSDGTRRRNLTDHPAGDGEPDW